MFTVFVKGIRGDLLENYTVAKIYDMKPLLTKPERYEATTHLMNQGGGCLHLSLKSSGEDDKLMFVLYVKHSDTVWSYLKPIT